MWKLKLSINKKNPKSDKGKGKGKGHPITGHEDPERE